MTRESTKILIVGAGVAGQQLSRQFRKSPSLEKLVGFIDDDISKSDTFINKVPVLGDIGKLGEVSKKYKIDQVLISIPSAGGMTIRRILEATSGLRLKFKIIPRTLEIIKGAVKLHQLRDLEITDLLGKAIIKSKQPVFEEEFAGKKILVTGAAGSIGSELCRQLVEFSPGKLLAFDWSENGLFRLKQELANKTEGTLEFLLGNIQDMESLSSLFDRFKPEYVFHAAAFKHVPLTQENPLEAVKNNVFGTANVVEVAQDSFVKKFIYISSDKAADPVSVMGATKLIGERIVTAANRRGKTEFAAVRFGNVLESSGSVIPIFRKQIADGGPVTVTDAKMTRYFMSIPEAVQLVLQATVLEKGGEIFVLEMGEQVKIDDLARFMIQIAGYIPDKDIKVNYIGKRPGERLKEQLLGKDEYITDIVDTNGSKIYKIANRVRYGNPSILELKKVTCSGETKRVASILKKFTINVSNDFPT